MTKKKELFTEIEKLQKLVKAPFEYYNKKFLYKEEFFQYYREKGWDERKIKWLWVLAVAKSGIVRLAVTFEADEFPPREIRSRSVLELVKDDLCEE
ncbi:MAG: hypothetical protein NDF54_08065 [archaeon GB-1867-035]|nr:hypothetical protein [Candidatus Culexmicrobium profundum]